MSLGLCNTADIQNDEDTLTRLAEEGACELKCTIERCKEVKLTQFPFNQVCLHKHKNNSLQRDDYEKDKFVCRSYKKQYNTLGVLSDCVIVNWVQKGGFRIESQVTNVNVCLRESDI